MLSAWMFHVVHFNSFEKNSVVSLRLLLCSTRGLGCLRGIPGLDAEVLMVDAPAEKRYQLPSMTTSVPC